MASNQPSSQQPQAQSERNMLIRELFLQSFGEDNINELALYARQALRNLEAKGVTPNEDSFLEEMNQIVPDGFDIGPFRRLAKGDRYASLASLPGATPEETVTITPKYLLFSSLDMLFGLSKSRKKAIQDKLTALEAENKRLADSNSSLQQQIATLETTRDAQETGGNTTETQGDQSTSRDIFGPTAPPATQPAGTPGWTSRVTSKVSELLRYLVPGAQPNDPVATARGLAPLQGPLSSTAVAGSLRILEDPDVSTILGQTAQDLRHSLTLHSMPPQAAFNPTATSAPEYTQPPPTSTVSHTLVTAPTPTSSRTGTEAAPRVRFEDRQEEPSPQTGTEELSRTILERLDRLEASQRSSGSTPSVTDTSQHPMTPRLTSAQCNVIERARNVEFGFQATPLKITVKSFETSFRGIDRIHAGEMPGTDTLARFLDWILSEVNQLGYSYEGTQRLLALLTEGTLAEAIEHQMNAGATLSSVFSTMLEMAPGRESPAALQRRINILLRTYLRGMDLNQLTRLYSINLDLHAHVTDEVTRVDLAGQAATKDLWEYIRRHYPNQWSGLVGRLQPHQSPREEFYGLLSALRQISEWLSSKDPQAKDSKDSKHVAVHAVDADSRTQQWAPSNHPGNKSNPEFTQGPTQGVRKVTPHQAGQHKTPRNTVGAPGRVHDGSRAAPPAPDSQNIIKIDNGQKPCINCSSPAHSVYFCPLGKPIKVCMNCHRQGHTYHSCPIPLTQECKDNITRLAANNGPRVNRKPNHQQGRPKRNQDGSSSSDSQGRSSGVSTQ